MSKRTKPFDMTYRRAVKALALSRGIRGATLNALAVLLDHCNGDSGQARPGRARIMQLAGISSERTMDKALSALRGAGIILPIAYPNGGRGRATVYAFGLPAWADETTAKNAGDLGQECEENPRNICAKPPQKMPKTPAKNADPTEEDRKEQRNAVRAGRPRGAFKHVASVAAETRNGVTFGKLVDREGYATAARLWQEWA